MRSTSEIRIRRIIRESLRRLMNESYRHAYDIKWMVGRNYYEVKNLLLKRGYTLNTNQCYISDNNDYMVSCFDNESMRVFVKSELHVNRNTGNLNGGNVLIGNAYRREYENCGGLSRYLR